MPTVYDPHALDYLDSKQHERDEAKGQLMRPATAVEMSVSKHRRMC